MKFGRHLEENKFPEWSDEYVNYKRLKKIIAQLKRQQDAGGEANDLVDEPPETWEDGVSLSTARPTNAAAMPVKTVESVGTLCGPCAGGGVCVCGRGLTECDRTIGCAKHLPRLPRGLCVA